MQNKNNWGSIPGTLKYEYTKSVTLFNIEGVEDDTGLMEMSSIGPINYTVSREFINPVYDDAKKVINYTMEHNYTLDASNKPNIEE